jgi:hypothetical protein
MIRPGKPALLIALLCGVLLLTRLGGTHLHLCFDGSEPPISLHVADAGDHHPGESAPHADQDVALGADLLVKKPAVASISGRWRSPSRSCCSSFSVLPASGRRHSSSPSVPPAPAAAAAARPAPLTSRLDS